jgi:arsenite-transporting ATPase
MRLIWYLGKGGVGKTTVALATALRSAELGYKTLVASTSLTPSLADVLDAPLGNEPNQVAENLWAQDMSVVTDLQHRRGILKRYIAELLGSARGNEEVPGDSPVFPGLHEMVSLLHINKLVKEGNFERIIIDTAPTGETLRLLTLPDAFRWGVDRLAELNGGAGCCFNP